jgi:hypothetical protein
MPDESQDGAAEAAPASEPARAEMHDAPPFLTWRAIYLIVVGALAVQVIAGAIVTALYR